MHSEPRRLGPASRLFHRLTQTARAAGEILPAEYALEDGLLFCARGLMNIISCVSERDRARVSDTRGTNGARPRPAERRRPNAWSRAPRRCPEITAPCVPSGPTPNNTTSNTEGGTGPLRQVVAKYLLVVGGASYQRTFFQYQSCGCGLPARRHRETGVWPSRYCSAGRYKAGSDRLP